MGAFGSMSNEAEVTDDSLRAYKTQTSSSLHSSIITKLTPRNATPSGSMGAFDSILLDAEVNSLRASNTKEGQSACNSDGKKARGQQESPSAVEVSASTAMGSQDFPGSMETWRVPAPLIAACPTLKSRRPVVSTRRRDTTPSASLVQDDRAFVVPER